MPTATERRGHPGALDPEVEGASDRPLGPTPRQRQRDLIGLILEDRLRSSHISLRALAAGLGRPTSTLSSWVHRARRIAAGERISAPGPRPRLAGARTRNRILAAIHAALGRVSIRELKGQFPAVTRRAIRDLKRKYKRVMQRRARRALAKLEWREHGAVWAMDHKDFGKAGIAGGGRYVLVVRELATGTTLCAQPCPLDAASVCAVLAELFLRFGAPIVLKSDNGSGFIAKITKLLLAAHGVLALYSPPGVPSYNGACEAGVGSIASRALAAAHAYGDGGVGRDELRFAQDQANEGRAEKLCRQEPRIEQLREDVWRDYRSRERRLRERRGLAPETELTHAVQASMDRFAIREALTGNAILTIWRRD